MTNLGFFLKHCLQNLDSDHTPYNGDDWTHSIGIVGLYNGVLFYLLCKVSPTSLVFDCGFICLFVLGVYGDIKILLFEVLVVSI